MNIINLLEGEYDKVQTNLVAKRDTASTMLKFEQAAAIHKQLERIQKVFPFLDAHRKKRRSNKT